MDEVQEAAVLETELNALGATPTARQIMDVIAGYSDSAVQIALKRTGGGGGQTPTLAAVLAESNDGETLGLTNMGDIGGVGTLTVGESEVTDGQIEHSSGALIEWGGAVALTAGTGAAAGMSNADGTAHIDCLATGAARVVSDTLGFYGETPVARPTVPASPTAQDVVDALVALGLVTQAP